ncbi:general secretion pathway protein M, partial [Pseudomonas syringae pv. actinidiae ICMP 19096]
YRQVKVSLTLNCAIEPLTAILHALEYQRPFLFVDEMSMRRDALPATGQSRGGRAMTGSLRPLEWSLLALAALLAGLIALIFSGAAHSPDWLPEQAPRNSLDQ